jgi:hypothetical protein
MNQKIETTDLSHPRNGTCHRCGWDGMVGRLPRHSARRRSSVRKFGRVCAECASDLIRLEELAARPERVRLVRTGPA